jgi:hypothetical protein
MQTAHGLGTQSVGTFTDLNPSRRHKIAHRYLQGLTKNALRKKLVIDIAEGETMRVALMGIALELSIVLQFFHPSDPKGTSSNQANLIHHVRP